MTKALQHIQQTGLPRESPPEARLFSVCGWLCGQRQNLKSISPKIVAEDKENARFSDEKRAFCGAAGQIRTADLILTKRPQNFFLTIFVALWPYPLQTACFPSLFENMVSTCSAALCGKLCGQTVVAVGLAIWRFAQMWSECGFLRRRSNAPAWFWQVTTELLLRWC